MHSFALKRTAVDIVTALNSVEIDFDGSPEGWGYHGGRDLSKLEEDARRAASGSAEDGPHRGAVDGRSRLMVAAVYLAYTSVYVLQHRHLEVRRRFETLLAQGRLACCHMTAMEYLNNAADPAAYEVMWSALRAHRWIDVTAEMMERALAVHRRLGAASQHRHFRLPDLIIAATAEVSGATVLYYDADYDRIAAVTGQPAEWVAPSGTL